jgi:hypothetical protein
MPQGMKDIVLIGKEAVARGTEAALFPLHQPFLAGRLGQTITNHLGQISSSSTWPYITDQVPLGSTVALTFAPDINANTIRDLIDLATKRTAGDQPSVSIKHSQAGVSDALYLGCVVSQLVLEYSRQASPDSSSLLSGTMNFECFGTGVPALAVAAGTQGAGRRPQIAKSTFTLNGVGALEVLSYRRTMTIAHGMGPPGENNLRLWIQDGELDENVVLTARFTTGAWRALVQGATEHAAVIVHATGTANETVTETMGKVQAESFEISDEDGTVVEQVTLKPFHTGAADPTVWAYGTAIGASVLAL